MDSLTLLVGVAASVLVFLFSPVYGLVVYLAAFAYYPSYLSVSLGTVDFTVRRIVILAVFAKLFLLTNLPRRFRFTLLDKFVILYFLAEIVAGATTARSLGAFLENRAGAIFDMVLPYFAVRLILINKGQYLALLKAIMFMVAPLSILAFYQCLTGHNLLGFVTGQYYYEPEVRYGFYRAGLTFSHAIMLGLYFAMLGPLCAGLWYSVKRNKWMYATLLGLMVLGVFSSMSSGPFLILFLSVPVVAFFYYRRYWKTALIILVLMCGSVEIISNRHFYDVLGGFTLAPETAWYRSKLIDAAVFEGGMSGHWLTGYGYDVDPGWGPMIDGRDFTDTVNHYLLILQRYGLVGFLPFVAMNIIVFKNIVDSFKAGVSYSDKWLVWCLAAGLLGLVVAFISVSLFGPPTTIYFMMLGVAGAMPAIVNISNAKVLMRSGISASKMNVPGLTPKTVGMLH